MRKVALIVMPWCEPFEPPPLGVSLLKASLSHLPVQVSIHYLNFMWDRIVRDGLGLSRLDHQRLLALARLVRGEWVFSGHLFPSLAGDRSNVRDLLLGEVRGTPLEQAVDSFLALPEFVASFIREATLSMDWGTCAIVGFSSMFSQHTASLALARQIKEASPSTQVVFGGPNCRDPVGHETIRRFPFVDCVFAGEADHSFPAYVAGLLGGDTPKGIPGIIWRNRGRCVVNPACGPISDLDSLPYPDFDDYFAQHRESCWGEPPRKPLAFEASRGCWWGMRSPCLFCSLNLIMAYRVKSPARILAELRYLVDKHKATKVSFTDSILGQQHHADLLPLLEDQFRDVEFGAEIKANQSRDQVRQLMRARFRAVQPGIESLSTPVLKIMRKGVTALENVRLLRSCSAAGISVFWNLLYGFPQEPPGEYENVLAMLQRITHLSPPGSVTRMQLGRHSAAYREAGALGITNIRPLPLLRHVYPFAEPILKRLYNQFEYDYADGRDPEEYLRPVKEFIDLWKSQQKAGQLILRAVDQNGVVIRDSRFNRRREEVCLAGVEAAIYRFCSEIRAFEEILAYARTELPDCDLSAEQLQRFLSRLHEDLMLVNEGNQWLSVAVDEDELPWLDIQS